MCRCRKVPLVKVRPAKAEKGGKREGGRERGRAGRREKENGEGTQARRETDDVTEDVERRFAINKKEKAKKGSGWGWVASGQAQCSSEKIPLRGGVP